MPKREEQVKLEIAEKYFPKFDCSEMLGNVDFSVAVPQDSTEIFRNDRRTKQFLLWAEAKHGTKANLYESFIQLILTIGKEQTYSRYQPPLFLGAFDEEKMAFIHYDHVQRIFFQNDFNWNVPPSDHSTKEFQQLKEIVHNELDGNKAEVYIFYYADTDKGVQRFISQNFKVGQHTTRKQEVTANNFTYVFNLWCKRVLPSIVSDMDELHRNGYLEGDFFLADLLNEKGKTIMDKLEILLQEDQYYLKHPLQKGMLPSVSLVGFKDGMKAHKQFWAIYNRPPREKFWQEFISRRDLLVPSDIRERKGSYFTPQEWVNLSQQYLADVLGENWQEEYYVWDCCAGTGNMEVGLRNKYRVWASTLDYADVQVMHQQIETGHSPLLKEHCFQFDFLNDDLQDTEKVPEDLRKILADEERRKRLIIYINPPYAEATNAKQSMGTGKNKSGVAILTETYKKYTFYDKKKKCANFIGKAGQELFAQFFIRVYCEIPGAWLAEFSKLKILQAPNFEDFRKVFRAKLEKCFLVPARTFDNVKGQFPIGFFIWNTAQYFSQRQVIADVITKLGEDTNVKKYIKIAQLHEKTINNWISSYVNKEETASCYLTACGTDFQHCMYTSITQCKTETHYSFIPISSSNLLPSCIYLSVRQCIPATWLNDRDQFLYPNEGWKDDTEFQNDCLAYTLFHGQNHISSANGINHWIPFTEDEVGAHGLFDSHFMSDFIRGKAQSTAENDLFGGVPVPDKPLQFSPEAQAVMDAGRELWRYYHQQTFANPNASFYDIKLCFQGKNNKGNMNPTSEDETYNHLLDNLKQCQKRLAQKIETGVYKYGFLYNGTGESSEAIEDELTQEETVSGNTTATMPSRKKPCKPKKPQKIIVKNIHVSGDLYVNTLIDDSKQ